MTEDLTITQATLDDAEEILALQKLAYLDEAKIYDDYTIPPLHQTLEETQREFKNRTFLKVLIQGTIVGSVRIRLRSGTCYIGKLIVHPDFQNRGIGTQLLRSAEAEFDTAERYELFTGDRSAKNLHLYRKLGYRIFREEKITPRVTLVYLEKVPPVQSGVSVQKSTRAEKQTSVL